MIEEQPSITTIKLIGVNDGLLVGAELRNDIEYDG